MDDELEQAGVRGEAATGHLAAPRVLRLSDGVAVGSKPSEQARPEGSRLPPWPGSALSSPRSDTRSTAVAPPRSREKETSPGLWVRQSSHAALASTRPALASQTLPVPGSNITETMALNATGWARVFQRVTGVTVGVRPRPPLVCPHLGSQLRLSLCHPLCLRPPSSPDLQMTGHPHLLLPGSGWPPFLQPLGCRCLLGEVVPPAPFPRLSAWLVGREHRGGCWGCHGRGMAPSAHWQQAGSEQDVARLVTWGSVSSHDSE